MFSAVSLIGTSTNHGATISFPVFAGNAYLYVLAQSFLFGHIKSYFLKNKVISSSFFRLQKWP